ncbi:hypothetical protein BJX76DRAFT_316590 [Aspergillus varians]
MKLWLIGGYPNVKLVFLINWSKLANDRVQGELRVYEPLPKGVNIRQVAAVSIFPVQQGGALTVPTTRAQLFGMQPVFQGTNAADGWQLSITRLRELGERWIRAKGFTPA